MLPSSKQKLDVTVLKATKSKVKPPKRKHVRTLILDTWQENGATAVSYEIFKRPMDTNDVVCWKCLITIHHLMAEGHPKVLDDLYFRISSLDALRSRYQRGSSQKGYVEMNALYAGFLVDKTNFHHVHQEFPGDFNLDKVQKKYGDKITPEKAQLAVTHMLDLQSSIDRFQKAVFETRNVDDCKASAFIPLVIESYNLYTLETWLLRKLVDEVDEMDVLAFLIEKFYSQYIALRTFYNDVSNIRFVTSIIAVPTLSQDPPVFVKTEKQPKKKREPKPKEVPPPQPAPAPVVPQIQVQYVPQQPPPPVVDANPFVIDSNPFAMPANPFAATTVHRASSWVNFSADTFDPPAPQVAQIQPVPEPKVDMNFGDLVSMVKTMKPTNAELEKKRREEERKKKEEAERKAREEAEEKRARELAQMRYQIEHGKKIEERKKKEEEEKKKAEEEARRQAELVKKREEERRLRELEEEKRKEEAIKKIVQEEASKEMAQLKVRIVELENLLQKEREKNAALTTENAELKARIQTLEKELAEVRKEFIVIREQSDEKQATIARFAEESLQLKEERDSIRAELANVLRKQAEENERQLLRSIESSYEALQSSLDRLDSPTNLGNEEATSEHVIRDTYAVNSASEQLVAATAEELPGTLGVTLRAAVQLFDDAKGVSRKIDDVETRQRLLDAARATGRALSDLLGISRRIGGIPTEEEDKKNMTDGLAKVKSELSGLAKAAEDSAKNQGKIDENSEDLEDLAERELLAAAKTIEEAAAALLASRPEPKADGSMNVSEAILQAAIAISKATSMLVTAAAMAQKERKASSGTSSHYRKDPTWAQGLISAAKTVASATGMLIDTANKAVSGEIEIESVIAASKAVAASTAQIIAATRAKAEDPNSPAQLKLKAAASAVTAATQQLVAAARASSKREEEEAVMETSGSDIFKNVREMEIQTEILKLEKDLEMARNRLFTLRRQQYKR